MEEYKRVSSEEIEQILAEKFPGFRCGQAKPAPVWLYGEGANLYNPCFTAEELAWINEHERLHKVFAARMKQRNVSSKVVGKSAISKEVAEEMGIPFIDAELPKFEVGDTVRDPHNYEYTVIEKIEDGFYWLSSNDSPTRCEIHESCLTLVENDSPADSVPLVTEETDLPHRDYFGEELKIRQLVRKLPEHRETAQDFAVVIGYAGDCQVIVQYEDGNQCRVMSYHFAGMNEQAPEELVIRSQQFNLEDVQDLERYDSFDRLKIKFAKKISVHYMEHSSTMYQRVLKAIDQINPRVPRESVNDGPKLPKFQLGDKVTDKQGNPLVQYLVWRVEGDGTYILRTLESNVIVAKPFKEDRLTLVKK